jgi:hypothetical protein
MGDVMHQDSHLDWRSEFDEDELAMLRRAIPEAIHRSQQRSARAHAEYQDPDGDQDVYGVGMARGAQKELQALIKELPSYREQRVAGTRRTLTYVGNRLVFLQRVGKKMPQNHRRYRPNYLPDSRREMFEATSNTKYTEPGGLFELPQDAANPDDDAARLADVLDVVADPGSKVTLFVPYYSSTPFSVGTIYWAPARLNGRYLEFTDPERLTYTKEPAQAAPKHQKPRRAGGFADGERPRTETKLRRRPEEKEGS